MVFSRSQLAHLRPRLIVAAGALGALTSACFATDANVKPPELLQQEQACVQNIEAGDYDRAESRCSICLEYSSTSAECLNGMGLIWYARGVDDKARTFFKEAIRVNNDFAQARNNLGVSDFNKGDFEAAASNFERSVEINPRYLDGRYNLALANLRMGERRRASAYSEETQSASRGGKVLDPNKVWFNIGESDRKYILEKYDRAEFEYRKIFELYPEHTNSYRDMGLIMTYRAQLEQVENKRRQWVEDAEQFFVRCLDLDGQSEPCHESLAHLYLASGRFDESLFHYVQCLASNKTNPVCLNELKLAYEGSQLKSEALQSYMLQLAENPGYAPGHYGFCIALFDKGLTDMAVTECENALKLDEKLCLAHYQLGLHYKSVLDRDLALQNCRGLISCAGDAKYQVEVAECKTIVQALEVQ
jgi:tetratricopeptide (TPR) repeat protein